MGNKTFGESIADAIAHLQGTEADMKRDLALIVGDNTVHKDIGERLMDKKEREKIKLSDDEKTELEALERAFAKLVDDQETCAAYFVFADKYVLRLKEIDDASTPTCLDVKSVGSVMRDVRSEMSLAAAKSPMKKGEDAQERAKKILKAVARKNGADDDSPESVIASEAWSKIDPISPVADELAKAAISKAYDQWREALQREKFELLRYAVKASDNRRQANVQQDEHNKRRANMNPGVRSGGFFERIGASLAKGFNSNDAKVPGSDNGKPNANKDPLSGFGSTLRDMA